MSIKKQINSEENCLVYFLRHGLTQDNLDRKYIGTRSNPGITDESKQLISERVAAGEVPEIKSLWVSPMRRAIETASLYFPDISPVVEDDVKERDFGIWDGQTWEQLKDIALYRSFIDSEGRVTPTEGEPYEAYVKRLDSILERIEQLMREEPENFPLAIVCHAGPVRYWTSKIFEEGEEYHNYFLPGAGCLAVEVSAADLRIDSVYDFYPETE
ncbi:MAG: histidine phosphatase family protein [Eubacteriales bacterium]|nr:histidine phosphatase family protein [Eubacteriales bacterium]MDD4323806.1 histidine phosphatase family protein [Eubacteriales bacterium]MDD4541282.1 histidine phosphatase family protein [Eubacteriales bacterium]